MTRIFLWSLLLCFAFVGPDCHAQSPDPNQSSKPSATELDHIIDRFIAREKEEVQIIAQFSPVAETYIQQVKVDKEGAVAPQKDNYFLSLVDFSKGVKTHS